jgi:hypothetical protein
LSRSVSGTIETELGFRHATTIGALLPLLWSLSPLGGQVSLRALERARRVAATPVTLRYLYTGPYATFLRANRSRAPDLLPVFTAALSAPHEARVAPRDMWGNVRMPSMRHLESDESTGNDKSCLSLGCGRRWRQLRQPAPPLARPT